MIRVTIIPRALSKEEAEVIWKKKIDRELRVIDKVYRETVLLPEVLPYFFERLGRGEPYE